MKVHIIVTVLSLIAFEFPLLADKKLIDCGKGQDLNEAVGDLSPGGTLTFTGVCNQNVLIAVPGVTLSGQGTAVISSPKPANDALTIAGAQRVTLQNFTVQNGNF